MNPALQIAFPAETINACGCVDYHGYSAAAGGTIIGGWIGFEWDDPIDPPQVSLRADEAEVIGTAIVCLHPREDVRDLGHGFVAFIQHDGVLRGTIAEAIFFSQDRAFRVVSSGNADIFDEEHLISHSRQGVLAAQRNLSRARLLKIFERPHYTGVDTVDKLSQSLHLELDKVYLCPPSGLVLRGWFLDPFSQMALIKVHCGSFTSALHPEHWITIRRPDVIEALGSQYGITTDKCGFMTYVPDVFTPGEPLYFEIETITDEVVFKQIPVPQSSGLGAIREILSVFDLRYAALTQGYDHVIGPAVEIMNHFRLKNKPDVNIVNFGASIVAPRCSIIIPLYGRMDFLEYQLAFFSKSLSMDHELIYVLDDPDKLREIEALSASCLARFNRPFVLVTLSHNVGYGPANNIGLKHARGKFICFLNSDVFPINSDWLECMIESARSQPNVGVVGALLLFEDGSIQHDACAFKTLPEFDDWTFALHPNKGRRLSHDRIRDEVEAVTGACMVLSKDIADELGGFDEGYVIGDFEDTDLCLRLNEKGLSCIIDYRAKLYHLERQSQGNQSHSWRMNLTLYNAWRFRNRWTRHG